LGHSIGASPIANEQTFGDKTIPTELAEVFCIVSFLVANPYSSNVHFATRIVETTGLPERNGGACVYSSGSGLSKSTSDA
jgi:hypothetical protein